MTTGRQDPVADGQGSTQIIAFLDRAFEGGCRGADKEVILISDGIEASDLADMYEGTSDFQDVVTKNSMAGCLMTFVGFAREGSIVSHRRYKELKAQWNAIAQHTGLTIKYVS